MPPGSFQGAVLDTDDIEISHEILEFRGLELSSKEEDSWGIMIHFPIQIELLNFAASKQEEVDIYDSSHTDFRNIKEKNDSLLKTLKAQNNDVIIDFGSGTGTFAIQATRQCAKMFRKQ